MLIDRLLVALAALVYATVLNWSYGAVESQLFAYQGMTFDPPGTGYLLLSNVLLLVPLIWMRVDRGRPSDLALAILYVTYYLPALFLPYHVTKAPEEEVLVLILGIAGSFLLLLGLIRGAVKPLRSSSVSWRTFSAIFSAIVLVGAYVVVRTPGFSLSVDIADLYTKRLATREVLGEGSLRGFLVVTTAQGLGPAAVVIGIAARSAVLLGAGVAALTTVFFLNGAKYSVLLPVIIVGCAFAMRYTPRRFLLAVLVGSTLGVGVGATRYLNNGDILLTESFSRRLILSKGASTGQYWEAFRESPFFMKDSGLRRLIGLPVARGKSFEIGERYGLGAEDNSGANAWAAAFGNFGFLGLFGVSVLIALTLRFMNRMQTPNPLDAATLMAAVFALVWGEAAFETSLVSTGVLLCLLILWFYVRTGHWGTVEAKDASDDTSLPVVRTKPVLLVDTEGAD